ncbi:hypothetical protein A7W90_16230 [Clostridium sp. Bc-iso-3]|nr:hypothetical protein A7W90_16230 [Clostridium sp. Bc-iso-3]
MEQKYGEFVGVDSLHASVIIEDTEENYIVETPEYFAPTAEIAGEAEVNNESTYYDNVAANNYVTEGATTLTVTVSGVPADKAAKYLGKHYDPATGRVIDTGEPNPPDVALAFRFSKGKDGYRYYQYLKGNFSGGTEEASTKSGGNVDIKTYQLTYTAVTTTHKWLVDGKLKPVKRIFADTTDEVFDAEGWFSEVQTPDSTAIHPPLVITDSDPEDGDLTVAPEINPVVTFNNKIKSYIVSLLDATSYDSIPMTARLDTTRKKINITPSYVLNGATKYLLLLSATDIYGRDISNEAIVFTTATEE